MIGTIDLEDDRLYMEPIVCRDFGVSESVIARARKAGELRSAKIGTRRYYYGRWIREWVERAATPDAEPAGVAG